MIKHIWSVLTSKSVVDSTSNNLSLIDILEKVSIDIAPVTEKQALPKDGVINIPLQYQMVNFLVKSEGSKIEKGNIKLDLINPGGKSQTILNKEFEIPKNVQRMRIINNIQGIGVTISGIYIFRASMSQEGSKYKVLAEVPLEIELHMFSRPASQTRS